MIKQNIILNSGVYEILNKINGKRYIGSTKELNVRKQTHFRNLKADSHPNRYLQYAFNKYGKNNFEFNVLEYCSEEYLLKLEQWYLDNTDWHYNLKDQAIGGGFIRKDVRLFESEDIVEMFETILLGFSQKEIAEYYNCGLMTVNNILKRNTYKEIEVPEKLLNDVESYLKRRKHGKKLDCEHVVQIRKLHSEGVKQIDLVEVFKLSKPSINDIVKQRSYKECL